MHDALLNDGNRIPLVGFGTHKIPDSEVQQAVEQALELGYRHIDTAQGYGNEPGVGRALKATGIERDDVFVTTKLTNSAHAGAQPREELFGSLEALGTDYVDLYLIHWPQPEVGLYLDAWTTLLELQAEGHARSIGVSNFNGDHLAAIIQATDEPPAVNQIECHPELQQTQLRELHDAYGIVTEHWAPLGQNRGLLDDQTVCEIAEAYGKTPAQIVLRWALQLGNVGNVVLPKSANRERAAQNLDVFGWGLDEDEMRRLGELDAGRRLGPDPLTMNRPNRASR